MQNVNRRQFLGGSLIIAAATQMWWPNASDAARLASGRSISFENAHTGDKFNGEYWQDGRYLPDAFTQIKKVLRDHRNNEIFPIDPRLMDILFVLQKRMDTNQSYNVFSGYRSPETNRRLRRMGFGVAERSLHMQGQAVDLRLPGRRLSDLRRQAVSLKAGGVGYYPNSSFVHLDTGRVRHW